MMLCENSLSTKTDTWSFNSRRVLPCGMMISPSRLMDSINESPGKIRSRILRPARVVFLKVNSNKPLSSVVELKRLNMDGLRAIKVIRVVRYRAGEKI